MGKRRVGMGDLGALACLLAMCQLLAPVQVGACGGLFCSLTPVDQTGERILFTVNGDGTTTAYVQIRYAGDRDSFAWIIPVAETPELDVFSQTAMLLLDAATQPAYPPAMCHNPVGAAAVAVPGVQVYAQEQVGPFDTLTVGGDSADQLVSWLQDNGYRITEAMVPYIQQYVDEGMRFLAMKLLPDADVGDIQPIAMTYRGVPAVPIRLTAVAAQPEMQVLVWILADRRYRPKNYVDLMIPDDQVTSYLVSNYLSVMSREIDKVGGHAFVTEYAQPTEALMERIERDPRLSQAPGEARDALEALLRAHPFVTRLRTRMSAEEMTVDPVFEPAEAGAGLISTVRGGSLELVDCRRPERCVFDYCGRAGACVPLPESQPQGFSPVTDACRCAPGATARLTTTGPAGVPLPYCEPLSVNFSQAPSAEDPVCIGIDCGGAGDCVGVNGNPTCLCDDGHAAIAVRSAPGGLACIPVDGPLPEPPVLPPIPTGRFRVSEPSATGDAGTGTGIGTERGPVPGPGQPSLRAMSGPDPLASAAPVQSPEPGGDAPRGGASLSCAVAPGQTRSRPMGLLGLLAIMLPMARARRRRLRSGGMH